MHKFATRIFPFNRSLTGFGVAKTLDCIKEEIPELKILKIKSGKKVFDWIVPQEWNVEYAYIICPDGTKICDFSVNNLHLVGYSISVDKTLELKELLPFLHSIPDQPNAIPYITSYYKDTWGFCLSDSQKKLLKNGVYKVKISTSIKPGNLLIGEIYIPGKTKKEIFL
jgi:aminopeptidase-like protein